MADVTGLTRTVQQRARRLRDRAAQEVVRDLRRAAPVDTGYLAETIREPIPIDRGSRFGALVRCTADYASFTNDGTPRHRIDGNPLLHFFVGGDEVFVRFVDHPGTDATHWWDDVVGRWSRYLREAQAAA